MNDELDITKEHITRKQIENLIGMRVRNVAHYQRALVHKSVLKLIRVLLYTKYLGSCPWQRNTE